MRIRAYVAGALQLAGGVALAVWLAAWSPYLGVAALLAVAAWLSWLDGRRGRHVRGHRRQEAPTARQDGRRRPNGADPTSGTPQRP